MYHTTRPANQWHAIPNMQTGGSTSETTRGSRGWGSRDTNESQDVRSMCWDKSRTNRRYHGDDQETVLTVCLGCNNNAHIMKLLYWAAEWHSFAKLRLHTNTTIKHLDMLTKEFGLLIRQFHDHSCSKFETMELPHEVAAYKQQDQCIQNRAPNLRPSSALASQIIKRLNLSTPKFHFLRDYVSIIWMFGYTDSFLKCSKLLHSYQAHQLLLRLATTLIVQWKLYWHL